MQTTIKSIIGILATVTLNACATPVTPRYSANTDNVLALRKIATSGVYVGEIAEPAKDDVKCRGIGRMRLQDNLTHAQFIRAALADELKLANAYGEAPARVTVAGELVDIDSSSGLGDGKWSMTLALRSTNGSSLRVSNLYRFRAGMAATAACNNVAQAFIPAVQDLIHKAVITPEFVAMVQ